MPKPSPSTGKHKDKTLSHLIKTKIKLGIYAPSQGSMFQIESHLQIPEKQTSFFEKCLNPHPQLENTKIKTLCHLIKTKIKLGIYAPSQGSMFQIESHLHIPEKQTSFFEKCLNPHPQLENTKIKL